LEEVKSEIPRKNNNIIPEILNSNPENEKKPNTSYILIVTFSSNTIYISSR